MSLAVAALERWGLYDSTVTIVARAPTIVHRVEPGPFTLRIEPRSRVTDAVRRSQLTWLRALGAEPGLTVPEPIPLPTGEPFAVLGDQRCVLLRWIEGESLLVLPPTEAARIVGRTIARLHLSASRWEVPSGFDCPEHELEVPPREVLRLSAAEHHFLRRAHGEVSSAMEEVGRSRETHGLVHGDLNFRNFVLEGGEACPFDFDEFGFGYFLSDLAEPLRVIAHLPEFEAMRAALLEGYRSERALSEADDYRLGLFTVGTFLSALSWAARPESAPRREEVLAHLPSWLDIIARLSDLTRPV